MKMKPSMAKQSSLRNLIGVETVVTHPINIPLGQAGIVVVDGERWYAQAMDQSVIHTNTKVTIRAICGIKLLVEIPTSPQS